MPTLRVRVVNVVDLFALETRLEHPHGLDDEAFDRCFGQELPVVFAFHGYPRIIHELIHRRPHPERFHVRGYLEEGSTTTPFDMVVRNQISRYHLALEAIRRGVKIGTQTSAAFDAFHDRLAAHGRYIVVHGVDLPEVADWKWTDEIDSA
jgi:xylulose-5-phosphate/fructose-6-phosphate phosphoketolase